MSAVAVTTAAIPIHPIQIPRIVQTTAVRHLRQVPNRVQIAIPSHRIRTETEFLVLNESVLPIYEIK